MIVPLFCHSCTVTVYDNPGEGEGFFQVKSRLRQQLSAECPRRDGRRCPMRGDKTPAIPSIADFEIV